MKKIKRDDEVIVLTGKYRGTQGKVLRVTDEGKRLFVEGVNMVKKHQRPNPNANIQGGIVQKEASIHVSNVAIYNPRTKKADRVGFKIVDGKKHRVYKSDGEMVEI